MRMDDDRLTKKVKTCKPIGKRGAGEFPKIYNEFWTSTSEEALLEKQGVLLYRLDHYMKDKEE